jgi:SPP1 gp7 family putative phage head morphogenesis protein
MPPDPKEIALAAGRELRSEEMRVTSRLLSAFHQSEQSIRSELHQVLVQIGKLQEQGQPVGAGWVWKHTKLSQALELIEAKVDQFSRLALKATEARQGADVEKAIRDTEKTFRSFSSDRVGPFRLVNVRSLEDLIGRFADGSPLSKYFERYGATTAADIEQQVLTGVLQGKRVRGIAKDLETAARIPRNRAIVTARTEPLRSYREATIRNYQANPGVVNGYIRLATLDRRTCPVCLALHGTRHKLTDPFYAHPGCRCTSIPIVIGANIDIGVDGETWFADQPDEVQEQVLGPEKLELYKAGDMKLADLVVKTQSDAFGPGLREKSIKDLGYRRTYRSGLQVRESDKTPLRVSAREPKGVTDNPPLPKPVEGRRYLDSSPGTTIEDFKKRIQTSDVEIFGFSDDGKTISHAPVLGDEAKVDILQFGDLLRNTHTIHNHPRSGFFSFNDFAAAIGWDMKSMTAVLKSGSELLLERPKGGWPDEDAFLESCKRGGRRAYKNPGGNKGKKLLKVYVEQVNESLSNKFGNNAPKIVLK